MEHLDYAHSSGNKFQQKAGKLPRRSQIVLDERETKRRNLGDKEKILGSS